MSMPKGKYYIGDLCYVMTDEEWEEFRSVTTIEMAAGSKCNDGEFKMKDGRRFATYGTAYGDGEYNDQYGHTYLVDAGLIGCILMQDIRAKKYENLLDLGSIIEFPDSFLTEGGSDERDWNGTIRFGHVYIETNPEVDGHDFDNPN